MQDYILPLYLEAIRNYKAIKLTYDLLNSANDLKIPVHSAGQWILDNMYIIEQEHSVAIEGLKAITENRLPYVKLEDRKPQIRVNFMANEIVEQNRGIVNDGVVSSYIKEYQKHTYVTYKELTLMPVMLRLALIKFLRRVCLNVFNCEIQKLKVEKLVNNSIAKDADTLTSKMNKGLDKMKLNLTQTDRVKTSNTAYIEYLAFRLKDMGISGDKYLAELKEETNKVGFTIDEAIEKEHSEVTKTTNHMGNGVTSIKTIGATNWSEVIASINRIDETLLFDYTKEYELCDFKTKNRYRDIVINLAKKYKLSEMYVAKKVVECSEKYQKHIGHFLIGTDKALLISSMGKSPIGIKIKEKIIVPSKPIVYIITILSIALVVAYLILYYLIDSYNIYAQVIISIISFVFGIEIADKVISYLVGKFIRPKTLPRFNFAKTIDSDNITLIAMPSVINNLDKLDKMISKMEVTYLANRSENMYYMLLGDCISDKKNKEISMDKEVIEYGRKKIEELNNKYPDTPSLFNFMYRKRIYSKGEGVYMGWERKRGALSHLNKLLIGNLSEKQKEEYMTLSHNNIPKVKYVITIDEDTSLSLGSAKELVAIMAHPLNKPVLSKDEKTVVKGYGLIQPAIGLDIEAANSSIFSKVFGGFGGLDIYTNAISNLYQDMFGEAIFTGKGIYDVEIFERLMGDSMPENLILSHDLLEGSYMRTGLASDVEVQDGFPHNYIAYSKRNQRWYRGDMQIVSWIFGKNSPINLLSRWKIFDNLRRETLDIFALILLIVTIFIPGECFVYAAIYVFGVINFGYILSILDNIIFGKNAERKQKQYIPVIYGIRANLLKMVFNFITIPYKAWITINAHITSIYRMTITKKNLLEWATAESIDAAAKEKIWYVYTNMFIQIIVGGLLLLYAYLDNTTILKTNFILFAISFLIISPFAAFLMSKKNIFKSQDNLEKEQDKEILEIGYRTWKFFSDTMIEINNYLAPDNVQENRRPKSVNRTSSTNIGFTVLAPINAYDLKYIDIGEAIDILYNVMKTVDKLEKWNGHLYNWYNTRTLETLRPRFISTVDSGNFVTAIYVVKQFVQKIKEENREDQRLTQILDICNSVISQTDFTKLYVKSRNIFSIGFDIDKNELVKSYYDMLMSEARLTSLVAIASRQVTSKHWFSLARNLIKVDRYKGLLSWSGTSFEYFMPNLFTKTYEHTLIDEALHFSLYSQMKYAKTANVPWGVSESAFSMQDNEQNYQYKAFGVPWLGLKRGLNDSMVVSPYSSLMCLAYCPKKVYSNLKMFKEYDMYGNYGYYESLDFTKKHIGENKKHNAVKTYMAHHQGMILTAIDNYINNNIIVNRFHSNPDIKAADILLKERVPIGIRIKQNIKNKYNKFIQLAGDEYTSYVSYTDKGAISERDANGINILTNGRMTSMTTARGDNYLTFNNLSITKNRYAGREHNGSTIIFTDKNTGNVWSSLYNPNYLSPEEYNSSFSLGSSEYYRKDGDIETYTKVYISPEHNTEIRKCTLVNNSDTRREIVINTELELSMIQQDTSVIHPAFSNLQIEEKYDEDLDMLIAKKRSKQDKTTDLYVYAKLIGIDLGVDFETEKSKLLDNNGNDAYDGELVNYPLCPVISYRGKIILDPSERQTFYYITGASYDKYNISYTIVNLDINTLDEIYKEVTGKENISAKYLRLKQGTALNYNKIIEEIKFSENSNGKYSTRYWNNMYNQSNLWKFGISGDIPIIQVPIGNIEDISLIDELINFMDYVKSRKVDLDIVILVDEDLSNGEPIKNRILKQTQNVAYMSYTIGNIYVLNRLTMSEEEKVLFDMVSSYKIENIDTFTKVEQGSKKMLEEEGEGL